MKEPKRLVEDTDIEDDGDEIDDGDETELPNAPVVSDTKALPPGYVYRDYLRLNGYSTAYRHKNSNGANLPARTYKQGCLIPKDGAPPLMIEHADNPNRTFQDPTDGKLKYHVETVTRIVRVSDEASNDGVIFTESGEVPYKTPIDPFAHIGRLPLRPEQVIVSGLRARADAKAAAAKKK